MLVADHDVNHGQPDICLLRRSYLLEVFVLLTGCIERGECVSLHGLAGEQVFVQKCSHICAANAVHGLHGCKTGLVPPDLNGHQHRTFTFGTPATLATAFAANQGIIHFDQVGKAIDAVPVCHGLADLPQHAMGCIPGNAQLLGSPQHRNATLV